MQAKDFLYFLTDGQGRPYKLDNAGRVILDNRIAPLPQTPDGWVDYTLKYARDTTYFGAIRNLTVPLKFMTDGKKIIQYLFYRDGIEAECYLRIAKLNRATGIHEVYYVGALDFSTFDDPKTDESVSVNILDNGLASQIKNKQGTTYEIPLGPDTTDPVPVSDDPTVNVLLDGIFLNATMSFTGLDIIQNAGWHWLDIVYVTIEGIMSRAAYKNSQFANMADDDPISSSDHWVFHTDEDTTVTVQLDYDITVQQANLGHAATLEVWTGKTGVDAVSGLTPPLAGGELTPTEYTGTRTITVTLAAGDNLYIYGSVNESFTQRGAAVIQYKKFDLKISALTRADATYCKALPLSFIFSRIISKISGIGNNSHSDILALNDAQGSEYAILATTGDAIRALDDISMKITFQDLFKALNCLFNVGFGVENEVGRLEQKTYWFDKDTILADLGEVSNLEVSVATDDIYNLIDAGYEPQTYDDVNGKDEFNNTSEFGTPVNRVSNTLDLVSPFRADMYGIEETRVANQGQDTTDTTSDDTIFLLAVESKPYIDQESGKQYYKLYRGPAGVQITGVISPTTAFNYVISPKNILLRHGNYIHGMLDKLDGKSLTFQTTNKNNALSVTYPAPPIIVNGRPKTIAESADVPISSLDGKLYLPYLFKFDTEVPDTIKNIFDGNPRGLVRFTWQGNAYTGFIMDCEIKPAFREAQSWTLLAGPDNDMSKLVDNG